jgi:hypothetical protein
MSHGNPEQQALADIAIISERVTKGVTPKLSTVRPGSADFDFMLATFCFDLARRLNYAFKATRGFAAYADPALASEVLKDNEAINREGLTWEQRARAAEEIMLRTTGEIEAEHDRLLREAAK